MGTRLRGKTLMQLIKQGWDEIPETMFSGALAGIGLILSGGVFYRFYLRGPRNYMYRDYYTVMRDTDVKDPKLLNDIYN